MYFLIITVASATTDCPIHGCLYCDDDKTYCNTCDYHYIHDPNNRGKCICDYNNHYYPINGECEIPGTENCEEGCNYCFSSKKCEECDISKNFRLIGGHCYCSEEYNFNPEPVNGECVCKEGYGVERPLECGEIEYGDNCSTGCESCLPRYTKCLNCRQHFDLNEGHCSCEEGYVLDDSTYSSKSRCLKIFPDSCPTGCNCDENNQVCLSCQENFIPEYYSDLETIYKCIPTFECPAEIQDGCQYCNETGQCIKCKDGFYFLPQNSSCIQRGIFAGECSRFGCITCESEYRDSCLVCENGFRTYYYEGMAHCSLYSSDPKKIIYANIDDEKIFGKDENILIKNENGDVTFNLQNIVATKKRPYFYNIGKNTRQIFLNNDNAVPFKIENTEQDTLTIYLSEGAKPYPKITIRTYSDKNIDLQSSLASFEGHGKITLWLSSNDEDKIQLDKITVDSNELTFNVGKDIYINEISAYDDDNVIQINSQNTRNNLKISISKLNLHLNSETTIHNTIEVDTLIAESKGQIKADSISVQHIEINCLASSIERIYWSFIEGDVTGIPQSIKINMNPANKSIYPFDNLFPELNLVNGYNSEFVQNCGKWAKIYNDNPTDLIYNHAECIDRTTQASLYITHKEEKPEESKNNNKTAVIAGSVVACVVAVGIVIFLLVFFLVIKKRKNNNNSSEQENEVEQEKDEEA